MDSMRGGFSTIDEYIAGFPEDIQQKLSELRAVIAAEAPQASERISYAMPTFYLNGNLVHFAAHQRHIGFYPAPTGLAEFEQELAAFKHSKGAVQFPLDQPLPLDLVRKIVRYRVQENLRKAAEKSRKK